MEAARLQLEAECRFLNSHTYASFDAAVASSGARAPPWPSGPLDRVSSPVKGLTVLRSYLSPEEHDVLLALALEDKPRRPPRGSTNLCVTCPQIPTLEWYVVLRSVCERLRRDVGLPHMPGTLTLNYYEAHEGLRAHTDNPLVIAELVIGLSLASPCVMEWAHAGGERWAVVLEPGTVVIQQGEARYDWTHAIPPGEVHARPGGGEPIVRSARVSVQLSDFDRRFFESEMVQRQRLDVGAPDGQ
ncbi:hypothetical protein AB1Y20_011567 [Prymnesium parvum]|uniref:Alpha-ketoglutarate-dependent dioxygenase AlkB-like domain-containing protein n=1 Tax=Prymnesium parvum TaxID=97485 RepID=A0AB34IHI6_PRYPA